MCVYGCVWVCVTQINFFRFVFSSLKKVVVIYSSLSTCDPGDIHETIAKLKTHKVRASVVGLGAEMVSE